MNRSLLTLPFDDSFVRTLPRDADPRSNPRQVFQACYSLVKPTPVQNPQLIAWSDSTAELLGLAAPEGDRDELIAVLAGNRLLPLMQPYAACYGGHQFGHWAGQLGDGRAITLGEYLAKPQQRWELQLKGAGITPYSRRGDGRAVLRSSLREFLCSEAMHHLGVPTTRALSLIQSSDRVVRDLLYDGHPRLENCAIVMRVAPSFVRFGNFEILAARNEPEILQQLARYIIAEHYSDLDLQSPQVFQQWYEELCRRTAWMIAHWLRVGFVHGVMNTDNMSILGLTIDYGPYGWMDVYEPNWTPNTTDFHSRRYRFSQQPKVAAWNLAQFGRSIASLLPDPDGVEQGLQVFRSTFESVHADMMAAKLGLMTLEGREDRELLVELDKILQLEETDMTIFFRNLSQLNPNDRNLDEASLLKPLQMAFYTEEFSPEPLARVTAWLRSYLRRLEREALGPEARVARMNRSNPKYVLRNYLAQQAIEAAEQGDHSITERLLRVLSFPYDEQPLHGDLAQKRPDWARDKPGCSTLSCSS